MQFSILATFAGLAAIAQAAAITPEHMKPAHMAEAATPMTEGDGESMGAGPIPEAKVVASIRKVTKVSASTDKILAAINDLITATTQAPKAVDDLKTIVTSVTSDITMLMNAPKPTYTTVEQTSICKAYIHFVHAHQTLLKTLIGKKGPISEVFGLGAAVAGVLRKIEGCVDTFALTLIREVPTCAAKAQAAQKMLDATLEESISAYG